MWEKNNESVKAAKSLAEELNKIWTDKGFVREVLDVIDGDLNLAIKLTSILQASPEIVPMEVFKVLSELKVGFSRESSELAKAKLACIDNPCDENWMLLLNALQNNKLFHVYVWELTEEEKAKFKATEIGKSVYIETPMVPVVLSDENERILMPFYTSQYEIGRQYRQELYCNQEESFEYAKLTIKTIKTIEGPIAIILDPDSDDKFIIPEEIVDKWTELEEA